MGSEMCIRDSRWTTVLLDHEGNEGPFHRRVWRVNEHGGESLYSASLTEEENEHWDRFLANIRTAPFPDGDPRNEPPVPLAPNARGAVGPHAATTTPQCIKNDVTGTAMAMDFRGTLWRPYGTVTATAGRHGLPCPARLAAHPSLLVGDAITVCIVGADDDLLVPAITTAVGDWNEALTPHFDHPDPAQRGGLGYAVFVLQEPDPGCDTVDVGTDYVKVVDLRLECVHTPTDWRCPGPGSNILALAWTDKSILPPPRITAVSYTHLTLPTKRIV